MCRAPAGVVDALGSAVGRRRDRRNLADGLQLDLDVADVDPKFSTARAALQGHYRRKMCWSRLPRRSLAFDVPAEYVNLAVGVTYLPR